MPDPLHTATLVALADTVDTAFDPIALLRRLVGHCVRIIDPDATAAAFLRLPDEPAEADTVVGSTESAAGLLRYALGAQDGPALESYHTGRPVTCTDLVARPARWPAFAEAATARGVAAVQAVPLRHRYAAFGALALYRPTTGPAAPRGLTIAQDCADAAVVGILHARARHRLEALTGQLQDALDRRITIEQAKGALAERLGISVDAAFRMLRDYARSHQQPIDDLARQIIPSRADNDQRASTPVTGVPPPRAGGSGR